MLEIHVASIGTILSKGADQTARMCGISAPLLFAYGINRVSSDVAHFTNSTFQYMCRQESQLQHDTPR